jgi:hypothetical protein
MLDVASTRVSGLHGQGFRPFRPRPLSHGSCRRRETTPHGLSDVSEIVPEFVDTTTPAVLVERLGNL